MFSHWLLGEVNLWFIAPMGPRRYSCLAYRAARWRSRGRLSAATCVGAIGVTVGMLVPDAALACGLAAALAIAGMYFLRCLHPRRRGGPDGDPRRRRVHSEGYHFVLTPVLLNSLMLALLAVFNNRLAAVIRIRWRRRRSNRAVPLGISVTREDIHAALLEGQFLDIDEDDVRVAGEYRAAGAAAYRDGSPPLRAYCGLRVTDRR